MSEEQGTPSLVFIYDLNSWYTKLHPITKNDLIDIVPAASSSFLLRFKNICIRAHHYETDI